MRSLKGDGGAADGEGIKGEDETGRHSRSNSDELEGLDVLKLNDESVENLSAKLAATAEKRRSSSRSTSPVPVYTSSSRTNTVEDATDRSPSLGHVRKGVSMPSTHKPVGMDTHVAQPASTSAGGPPLIPKKNAAGTPPKNRETSSTAGRGSAAIRKAPQTPVHSNAGRKGGALCLAETSTLAGGTSSASLSSMGGNANTMMPSGSALAGSESHVRGLSSSSLPSMAVSTNISTSLDNHGVGGGDSTAAKGLSSSSMPAASQQQPLAARKPVPGHKERQLSLGSQSSNRAAAKSFFDPHAPKSPTSRAANSGQPPPQSVPEQHAGRQPMISTTATTPMFVMNHNATMTAVPVVDFASSAALGGQPMVHVFNDQSLAAMPAEFQQQQQQQPVFFVQQQPSLMAGGRNNMQTANLSVMGGSHQMAQQGMQTHVRQASWNQAQMQQQQQQLQQQQHHQQQQQQQQLQQQQQQQQQQQLQQQQHHQQQQQQQQQLQQQQQQPQHQQLQQQQHHQQQQHVSGQPMNLQTGATTTTQTGSSDPFDDILRR